MIGRYLDWTLGLPLLLSFLLGPVLIAVVFVGATAFLISFTVWIVEAA